jgi:hypothetical protein
MSLTQGAEPAWSPDGRKIAYSWIHEFCGFAPCSSDYLYTVNPDGTGKSTLTFGNPDSEPSWQPLGGLDRYPRPGSGTPFRVPLVPAYQSCTSPNSTHVPPLSLPSCDPPQTESSELTTSTQGFGSGDARYIAVPGDPSTAADEADVRVTALASDVRIKGGADYTGMTILRTSMRITDSRNGFGGAPGTVEDFRLDAPARCVPTLSPVGGSVCSLDTSADALVPGLMRENANAVMSLLSVELLDAGADGKVGDVSDCPPKCGTGDEEVFMRQGAFVP